MRALRNGGRTGRGPGAPGNRRGVTSLSHHVPGPGSVAALPGHGLARVRNGRRAVPRAQAAARSRSPRCDWCRHGDRSHHCRGLRHRRYRPAPWLSWPTIGPLIVTAGLAAVFVGVQARSSAPLLPRRMYCLTSGKCHHAALLEILVTWQARFVLLYRGSGSLFPARHGLTWQSPSLAERGLEQVTCRLVEGHEPHTLDRC